MDGVFFQYFFDLGLVSSRLAASKEFSEQDNANEYEELKNILISLNLDVPSPGESFDVKNWTDQFAPPNLKLKKSLFRLGRVAFALFMLGKNGHPAGESKFLSLFDVINIKKSIGETFIDNLHNGDKREAFILFINQIVPEIECLDVPEDTTEDHTVYIGSEALTLTAKINDLRNQFKDLHAHEWYYTDIDNDLREIATCLENKCYRASLSSARRVLEFSLKLYCKNNNIDITNVWNFDKLLDTLDTTELQIDSSMIEVWHTINQQRIIDSNSKTHVPPPSHSEAQKVCQSLLDTIKEVFAIS